MKEVLEIRNGRTIRFENLLCIRKEVLQEELNNEVINFCKEAINRGYKKTGPLISAVFGYKSHQNSYLLDVEVMFEVEKIEIEPTDSMYIKPIFNLVHAIHLRHDGDINLLEASYSKIQHYLKENSLQQITPVYNVSVNDEFVEKGEKPIIDLYVGVNPSVL